MLPDTSVSCILHPSSHIAAIPHNPFISHSQEDRMTPRRKRHQMLMLEEAMHSARMDFNHRFLALREVKRKVITEINTRCAVLLG